MRSWLDEKKTFRFYLALGMISAVMLGLGYYFGLSSGIGLCVKVATKTLNELGMTEEDLNKLVERYLYIGQHSG